MRLRACSLIALIIPLAVSALPSAAGAGERDADYLRGSMAPSYPVAQARPLPDDAAPTPFYQLADAPPPFVSPQITPWTGFYLGGTLNFGAGSFATPLLRIWLGMNSTS